MLKTSLVRGSLKDLVPFTAFVDESCKFADGKTFVRYTYHCPELAVVVKTSSEGHWDVEESFYSQSLFCRKVRKEISKVYPIVLGEKSVQEFKENNNSLFSAFLFIDQQLVDFTCIMSTSSGVREVSAKSGFYINKPLVSMNPDDFSPGPELKEEELLMAEKVVLDFYQNRK